MFTEGCDIFGRGLRWGRVVVSGVRWGVLRAVAEVRGRCWGVLDSGGDGGCGCGVALGAMGLWRPRGCGGGGQVAQGATASPAGSGWEPGGLPAGLVGLAGVVGGEDPVVAHDEQAGDGQGDRGRSQQSAPAAADVVAGGVFGGGEGAFGGAASRVGDAVRVGGVVVPLRGLAGDLGWDGDGLLGAAGGGGGWAGVG